MSFRFADSKELQEKGLLFCTKNYLKTDIIKRATSQEMAEQRLAGLLSSSSHPNNVLKNSSVFL